MILSSTKGGDFSNTYFGKVWAGARLTFCQLAAAKVAKPARPVEYFDTSLRLQAATKAERRLARRKRPRPDFDGDRSEGGLQSISGAKDKTRQKNADSLLLYEHVLTMQNAADLAMPARAPANAGDCAQFCRSIFPPDPGGNLAPPAPPPTPSSARQTSAATCETNSKPPVMQ